MAKLVFRLSLLLMICVVGGFVWFLGAYNVVRTNDGYHVIRKEGWQFTTAVVDTRNWKLKDYWKNSQISAQLASLKLKDLSSQLSDHWNQFTDEFEAYSEKHQLNQASNDVKERMSKLKEETQKRFQELSKRFEEGDLDMTKFKNKLSDLQEWARTQLKHLENEVNL